MQPSLLLVLAGFTAATTVSQTTATSSLPTTLPGLVSNVPSCALPCWNKVSTEIGCDTGNLKCLCETPGELEVKMGICILSSTCTRDQLGDTNAVIEPICDAVGKSPSSEAIASASSIITGAVGKATATASSTHKPTSTNAASLSGPGIGMAMAAFAAAIVI
ncbi:uncharacterized protein CTRU02_201171 [Colletotrichum truncatum]|uniref:Uncharacterized protein n=1 Tax=Colletotrichum truncatum TaxID=5467 RepID=A0ACC3ZGM6_COLTU|nr:uncharacterized protein CTRU02_07957 [Colletotrichum truncatum]KAF6790437.1 hypothetical protein CTRU02_07957 [Colletotrichum truncatum]